MTPAQARSSAVAAFVRLEIGLFFVHRSAALVSVMLPQRQNHRGYRQGQQGGGNRVHHEQPGIRVGHDRAHQVDFDLVAQDQPENQPREKVVVIAEGAPGTPCSSIGPSILALAQHGAAH